MASPARKHLKYSRIESGYESDTNEEIPPSVSCLDDTDVEVKETTGMIMSVCDYLPSLRGKLDDLKKHAKISGPGPVHFLVGWDVEYVTRDTHPKVYSELATIYKRHVPRKPLACIMTFATKTYRLMVHVAKILRDNPMLDGRLPRCLLDILQTGSWTLVGVGSNNDASICHDSFETGQIQGVCDMEIYGHLAGLRHPSLEGMSKIFNPGAKKADIRGKKHDWSDDLDETEIEYALMDAQLGYDLFVKMFRPSISMLSDSGSETETPMKTPPRSRKKKTSYEAEGAVDRLIKHCRKNSRIKDLKFICTKKGHHFKYTCKYLSHETDASARNKRMAKNMAAQKMIGILGMNKGTLGSKCTMIPPNPWKSNDSARSLLFQSQSAS